MSAPVAIVVGASSGIGEAIARDLAARGYRVGVAARRRDKLDALAAEIGGVAATVDLGDPEGARTALAALAADLGQVELWVLNAGTGDNNPEFRWEPERDTLATNVTGFAAMADVAVHHCLASGRGQIVGVSSVARFRGSRNAIGYAASKAFVSVYLDGIRDLVRHRRTSITVTEACPGFVDTPLMKFPGAFWVASPAKAARQIVDATLAGRKIVYVTRRWRLIAWLLNIMPR
ncbi:SDR family NAD(P)-dependent oxidoreductase [Glacieibacterium sp.]|uniref:SDR family NAD(P)-dependent oxidoreductase n=1 Tax=Glacieibacterium sp. TaxID=2860237 RepID=UPI003B0006B9